MLCVLSYIAWSGVNAAVEQGVGGTVLDVLDRALFSTAVLGLQTAVFELVPLARHPVEVPVAEPQATVLGHPGPDDAVTDASEEEPSVDPERAVAEGASVRTAGEPTEEEVTGEPEEPPAKDLIDRRTLEDGGKPTAATDP